MAIPHHEDNLVVTYRGGVIENTHHIHAAVTDSSGNLLFSIGNPHRVTHIRSAAKPLQTLAVLETGGPQQYGFDAADIALMCASHNSEDKHVSRARSMLAKIGAGAHESHLMCGGHHSVDPELAQAWYRDVYTPQRINNNCSGKHVGMFAGARAIGASLEGYHLEGHPIQQRVIKVVEEVSGLSKDEVYWGIDGCNMPAAAMPLKNLAQAFVHFAKAADETAKTDVNGADTDSVSGVASALTQRTVLSATVFNAMAHHADMVAGRGRFCTLLMDAFEGTLIGKVGAEGGYGIGIRASKDMKTRLGVDGALGIAVKVGDGNLDVFVRRRE